MTQYRKNTDYYRLYEQKRRQEGSRKKGARKELGKAVRKLARDIELETGIDENRAWSAIRVAIFMVENRLSYRRLATHLENNASECRRCGLDYSPSKSTLHDMVKMIWKMGKKFMNAVVSSMSDKDHIGDMYGDSTGLGVGEYRRWVDAKYGEVSVHDYVKLHVMAAVHGRILAFEVTVGTAGDSPEFARMYQRIPEGSGIVALDPAYDSYDNCRLITEKGRVPVIKPAKGRDKPRGFNPRARMLTWLRDRPDEFWRAYHKRSPVESLFSSIKARTGAILKSKLEGTRIVELFAHVLCYNLVA